MARAWYAYKGTGNPTDQLSSFSIINGFPGCSDGNELCAIYAPDGNKNPAFISNNLQLYISTGLAQFVAQPNIPNAQIFVAFKSPS